MLAIASNLQSLNAQRNLGKSQMALQRSLERLSSGSRINSARDDAAGQAISDRMQAQIRGLNQAVRNASDGISLAQTVDGSLGEVTENLQRIRELAVQSANATNSAADRVALDAEVQQRLAEVNRITSQTTFNGNKLLNGSRGNVSLQVGANVGETISVDLSNDLRASNLGGTVQTLTGTTTNNVAVDPSSYGGTTAIAASANKTGAGANSYGTTGTYAGVSGTAFNGTNFTLNGQNVQASSGHTGAAAAQDATSAYAKAAAITASDIDGITATANTHLSFGTTGGTSGSTDFLALWTSTGSGAGGGWATYDLHINGVQVINANLSAGNIAGSVSTTTVGISMASAISSINGAEATTGVHASVDADGNLQLVAADGRNIRVQENISADIAGISNHGTVRTAFSEMVQPGMNNATSDQDHIYRGEVTLSSKGNVALGGTAATAGFTGSETLAGTNLASSNVLDMTQANNTISRVDQALTTISNARSTFGAVQNRLDSVVASLQTASESLSSARSRIQDADFASETASLTKSQILQQAGTAMLAQANQLPQGVLSLLR